MFIDFILVWLQNYSYLKNIKRENDKVNRILLTDDFPKQRSVQQRKMLGFNAPRGKKSL